MSSSEYKIIEQPLHSGRKIRVVCVGAGASGLLLAYKINHNFYESDVTVQIYEKNADLGGTWLENRYPGCACDCPAQTYTFSFAPKTDWSQTFATSPEIFRYFDEFADKNDLKRHISYNSRVSAATWNAASGMWDLEIMQQESVLHDSCDVLINASGILNNWRWPAIPGLDDFRGPKLHSAAWDETLDLTGKNVGLIGNGSSGIQILPAILPRVKSIVSFIREPTWIAPIQMPGFEARDFTKEEQQEFRNKPGKHVDFRKRIEHVSNQIFPLFLSESDAQKQAFQQYTARMRDSIDDEGLKEKLVPQWNVGCRRLTPGTNYLEGLFSDKSSVVYGEITHITEQGPATDDGHIHEVDVLVCATGFDTTFKPRFPLLGLEKTDLSVEWKKEPSAYLGVAAPKFPNYFMFLGPNCPIGNGPVLIGIEAQADYFMKFIHKMRQENIKSFSPTQAATEEYKVHKDLWMKRSVWDQECRSWYKNVDGKITAVWAGSVPHYLEVMESPRFEDYLWEPLVQGNRWSFLGNGFSQRETAGADLSWYIRSHDDSIPLGKTSRFAFLPPDFLSVGDGSGHDAGTAGEVPIPPKL